MGDAFDQGISGRVVRFFKMVDGRAARDAAPTIRNFAELRCMLRPDAAWRHSQQASEKLT